MESTPRAGEIFYLTKDKPYQIITMGIHKETCESMVIYQALFGDYGTYVLPLAKFMDEAANAQSICQTNDQLYKAEESDDAPQEEVNSLLLGFLDADSYSRKLEVITSNIKTMDDRLINDMAASLDCTVDEGPIDQRLHGLIYCLKQLSRFEVKRLR